MGQSEILGKLNMVLKEDIVNECQVVYILSRIRKDLEIENLKGEYKYLNFYCNWALHPKLERIEPVADVLREFMASSDEGKFLNFDYLNDDLKRFLDKKELSKKLFKTDNFLKFINLLVDILSDTPLTVTAEESKVITIKKPQEPLTKSNFHIPFKIE